MLKSRIRVGGSWEIYVYPESGFKSKILEIGLKKSTFQLKTLHYQQKTVQMVICKSSRISLILISFDSTQLDVFIEWHISQPHWILVPQTQFYHEINVNV